MLSVRKFISSAPVEFTGFGSNRALGRNLQSGGQQTELQGNDANIFFLTGGCLKTSRYNDVLVSGISLPQLTTFV